MRFVSRYISILQNIEKRWSHFDTSPIPIWESCGAEQAAQPCYLSTQDLSGGTVSLSNNGTIGGTYAFVHLLFMVLVVFKLFQNLKSLWNWLKQTFSVWIVRKALPLSPTSSPAKEAVCCSVQRSAMTLSLSPTIKLVQVGPFSCS